MNKSCDADEYREIKRLFDLKLPPITSVEVLSVMSGYNAGFLWSLINRPEKYYRKFQIPKGRSVRYLEGPQVSLKLIQKWLSIHFERRWTPPDTVFGFVKGRSHIDAAKIHIGAEWVASVDIEDFFPSTPVSCISDAIRLLGYSNEQSILIISRLCSYNHRLPQGAPSSPVISNIVLQEIDSRLIELADRHNVNVSRYADDVVFSGTGEAPEGILDQITACFDETPWRISSRKKELIMLPRRLKVHGLLVHGQNVRLTKGYRNRIRAYKHLMSKDAVHEKDVQRIAGHLNFAKQVEGC